MNEGDAGANGNYEECAFLIRLPLLSPNSPKICLCEASRTKQKINREKGGKELFYTDKDGKECVTPYMFKPCVMKNNCQKFEPRPKFPET